MKFLNILFLPLLLMGCFGSSDEDRSRGYSDGYAAGYNTTCNIRATLISGEWSNSDYTSGYNQGYAAGAYACRNKN